MDSRVRTKDLQIVDWCHSRFAKLPPRTISKGSEPEGEGEGAKNWREKERAKGRGEKGEGERRAARSRIVGPRGKCSFP